MPLPKSRSSSDGQTGHMNDGVGLLEMEDLERGHGILGQPGGAHPRSVLTRFTTWAAHLVLRFICYPPPGTLRLRRTSWLDGVRGVAALNVYMFHAMGLWTFLVPAWHADKDQTSILQLPLLRTLFVAGGGAVSVFFVLSGYVLTHRCLRLIRSGAARDVYPAVGSSMFRRGFRLYLPPVLLTFAEMLATRLGYPPPLNFDFVPEPTFAGQLWDWVVETNKLINPAHNFSRAIRGFVTHPKYDAVIWTIPVEFYGSFVCYFLLLALARVPAARTRMAAVALLVCVPSMALGCWNICCFTAGMLIADFNLGQEEDEEEEENKEEEEEERGEQPERMSPTRDRRTVSMSTSRRTARRRRRRFLWVLALLAALYLASFPTLVYPESRAGPAPGFEALRALIPPACRARMEDPARFWWSVAGVLLLLSLSQMPPGGRGGGGGGGGGARAFFETRACQYLGRISFALYLVHEFCIVLFGAAFKAWLVAVTGVGDGVGGHGVGYWVVCAAWFGVFSVLMFAVAAQVEKWVDQPSVRFAKAVEERALRVWRRLR